MGVRQLNKLTPREVAAIKQDGWHSDGGGLYIRVSDDGRRRRWIFRFVLKGKVTEIGLGASPTVTLARAREERRKLADEVKAGRNPIVERQRNQREQANRKTFEEVARAVVERDAKSKGASSLYSWERSLHVHCAKIVQVSVGEITVDDVLSVVKPLIDADLYPTARRTLARIADVLGYAIVLGWRTTANVAAWNTFKHVMPKQPKSADEISGGSHHPMLPYSEAPAVIATLRASQSMSARALEIIALTALRLNEARLARWQEFDFATATWTVPASRMKRRVLFKVPLSDRALAILDEIKAHRRPGPYVFLGKDRHPVARNAVWMQCKRLAGSPASVHGLRATFRSWCADNGVDDGVAEACLSHGPGDATKAAYNRAEMVARRRVVIQNWSDYLNGKEAAEMKVVPLKRA
jgi:integrase